MPAEWEPHAGTWLAWPHRKSDWPGKIAPIRMVYGEIIRKLEKYEEIHILVPPNQHIGKLQKILQASQAYSTHVHLHQCETDRSWVRDSGPIFVWNTNQEKYALDWHFNAWAKYPDWQNDDAIPAFVARTIGVKTVQPRIRNWRVVLEGGSIDVNGQGLMLTTEECLLSTQQHRNPPLDRADYEAVFAEYLGIQKVLWLNCGIVGDDTHGHVDDIARFVDPNTIVAVVEDDPTDENYVLLQENIERLRGFKNLDGSKLEIVLLPMPKPVFYQDQRLPASYANFYIANDIVLVPTFNDPADRVALGILEGLFPDREVVGIHSVDLVWGLGTLHCMTQQEPA